MHDVVLPTLRIKSSMGRMKQDGFLPATAMGATEAAEIADDRLVDNIWRVLETVMAAVEVRNVRLQRGS